VSAVLCGSALGLGVWAHNVGRPWQTMVFLALTALQLGVALGLRPRLFTTSNLLLPLAVAGSYTLALAGVYVPALQSLLHTVPLSLTDVAIASSTVVVGWAASWLTGLIPTASGKTGRIGAAGRTA